MWIGVATAEMAILDLLGRVAGKSVTELIGERRREAVKVYRANNQRGKSAGETVEIIRARVAETGAEAVKFKIGGPHGRPRRPARPHRGAHPPDGRKLPRQGALRRLQRRLRRRRGRSESAACWTNTGSTCWRGRSPFDWYEDIVKVAGGGRPAGGRRRAGGEPAELPLADRPRGLSGLSAGPVLFRRRGPLSAGGPDGGGGRLRVHAAHLRHGAGGISICCNSSPRWTNPGAYHEFKGLSPGIPFDCPTSSLVPEDGEIAIPPRPRLGRHAGPAVDRPPPRAEGLSGRGGGRSRPRGFPAPSPGPALAAGRGRDYARVDRVSDQSACVIRRPSSLNRGARRAEPVDRSVGRRPAARRRPVGRRAPAPPLPPTASVRGVPRGRGAVRPRALRRRRRLAVPQAVRRAARERDVLPAHVRGHERPAGDGPAPRRADPWKSARARGG